MVSSSELSLGWCVFVLDVWQLITSELMIKVSLWFGFLVSVSLKSLTIMRSSSQFQCDWILSQLFATWVEVVTLKNSLLLWFDWQIFCVLAKCCSTNLTISYTRGGYFVRGVTQKLKFNVSNIFLTKAFCLHFSSELITLPTLKRLIDCLTLQKKRKILNTEGMLVNIIPLNSPSQWYT